MNVSVVVELNPFVSLTAFIIKPETTEILNYVWNFSKITKSYWLTGWLVDISVTVANFSRHIPSMK